MRQALAGQAATATAPPPDTTLPPRRPGARPHGVLAATILSAAGSLHRRVGVRRAVIATLGVLGGVLLARQVAGLEVGDLFRALSRADVRWVVIAAALSVVPLLGAAINLAAFTPGHVSLRDAFSVQVASGFVTVVTPPTVGQLAVNARFLHRLGHPLATVTAAVGLTQLSSLAVSLVLLAGALAVTGTMVTISWSLILGVATGTLLAGLGLLCVPVLRRPAVSFLSRHAPGVGHQLREAVRSPRRLAAGLGGGLLLSAGYIATLSASIQAFDVSLPLAQTAIVLLAGNALGSAAPTPAGLGAVEAALAAGLVAAGLPVAVAVPAVLLHRALTVWARVVPGWLALVRLRRTGVL